MLMLGCEDAPLRTHQPAFTELLRVVRCQLHATLGSRPAPRAGEGAGGGGAAAGEAKPEAAAPFGLPMVEELLPDSFLRKMFGSFFHMLQVCV